MMSLMVPIPDFAYGVIINNDATDGTCTAVDKQNLQVQFLTNGSLEFLDF
jgi:hypothetical protein